jgi:chorismate mutase / prephenate dehydratase
MMAIDKPDSFSLDQLRRQIDAVDDRLHELLIGRGDLVEAVARLKRSDRVAPFRPGREAQILRRLVSHHRGRFPRSALVRIWREILGGSVEMQTDLSVAVCEGCWDMARDHFGGRTPMMWAASADEIVLAVGEGRATVGVVPLPDDDDPAPWWTALAAAGAGRPRVVARLPFGIFGNAADPYRDAFVIAAMEPEASGEDDTLLVIAAPDTVGGSDIAGAFLAAKFECNPLASFGGDGTVTHLVEVEAFLADGDPRIGGAVGRLGAGARSAWLGAYARPLPDAALDGVAPE